MRNCRIKKEPDAHLNNQIINLMNLKLIESRNHQPGSHRQSSAKDSPEIINTPSTVALSKKYYSCELSKPRPDQHQRKASDIQPALQRQSNFSSTKILTLDEIKYKSRLTQAEASKEKEPKRSSSRKIFVSIAKSNNSKGKGYEPQIKQVDCKMLNRQPSSLRQKLKINIYKDISRNIAK